MTGALRAGRKAFGRRMGSVSNRIGAWAIIDQGVASAGTFLTFVILARVLDPSSYGRFALVYGTLAVLNNIHGGLVIYPLMLKAAGDGDARRTCMQGLFTTILLAPPQLAVVAGACWYAGMAAVWPMAAVVAWQCQESTRRVFTARLQQARAIPGDAVSYLGQAALLAGMSRVAALSLDQVFLIIALTSALSAVVQAIQVGPVIVNLAVLWRGTRDFVHGGRWATITNMLSAAIPQLFLWNIALQTGTRNAGAFQAVASIVNAINPVTFSIGHLVFPATVRCMAEGDLRGAIRTSSRYALQGAILIGPYLAVLLMIPGVVLSLVYGAASPYSQLQTSLRILTIYSGLLYSAHLAGSMLYGMGKSDLVCRAHVLSAAIVIFAIPSITIGGMNAAIVCLAGTASLRLMLHLRDIASIVQRRVEYSGAVTSAASG